MASARLLVFRVNITGPLVVIVDLVRFFVISGAALQVLLRLACVIGTKVELL